MCQRSRNNGSRVPPSLPNNKLAPPPILTRPTAPSARSTDRAVRAVAEGKKPTVCMVAYTDYVFDARVRREAETLAANGFRVLCIKIRNGPEPETYVLNGVEIRELNIPKYQGKSPASYVASYLRFLVAASAICARLLLKGDLEVV